MLRVGSILCLVSQVSPQPASLRQAVRLAASCNATLHVMQAPPVGGRTVESDVFETMIERVASASGVKTKTTTSVRSVPAIQRYVLEENVDLVVTDTPTDRGPIPPMADPATRELMEQVHCPVFVVGQVEDPSTIRHILVPVDLSAHSHEALSHATALATLYDASVTVMHVIDTIPYVALTPTDRLSLSSTTLSEHRARRRLQSFVQNKGDVDVDVSIQSHLAYGDAGDQIGRFISERDVDLLVLSSHGTMTRPQRPLGQVADRVLRRVTCPTFLVPAFGQSLISLEADSGEASASEG